MDPKKGVKETREYGIFNFFKLSVEVLKRMEKGELDPFQIMKREFIKLTGKGIKPVIIIDELQAIDHIYMNNGKDRQLIIELFNFFVAMTKESHLAHIIIASSDGYFLNTVYNDSRLKKTSKFFKVDYFSREDVMEWLLNVERYSRITDFKLDEEEARKIWDFTGGSAWEIQDILSERLSAGLDDVLDEYKKKVQAMISHYCEFDSRKREILQIIAGKRNARAGDFEATGIEAAQLKELLRDMVRNNILYFDPMDATYSPQGSSYFHGITGFIASR
jgi:AAA+ ATPase superfamily predicted ATPase